MQNTNQEKERWIGPAMIWKKRTHKCFFEKLWWRRNEKKMKERAWVVREWGTHHDGGDTAPSRCTLCQNGRGDILLFKFQVLLGLLLSGRQCLSARSAGYLYGSLYGSNWIAFSTLWPFQKRKCSSLQSKVFCRWHSMNLSCLETMKPSHCSGSPVL